MSADWWPSFEAPAAGLIPPRDAIVLTSGRAAALQGRLVLIGITELAGDRERHFQTYGRIVGVDASRGVTIACEGVHTGRTFVVPPDGRAFHPAQPGPYRLRSTGETVIDPDFLVTFTRGARSLDGEKTQSDIQ